METFAEELKPFGIDVNAVAPGALKTRLVEQVLAAGPEKVGSAFFAKNKKWAEEGATPLELGAQLCAYLASSESDGITGKLISAQWGSVAAAPGASRRSRRLRYLLSPANRAGGSRQKMELTWR